MLIWFLPAILILGLITSYTDIKNGKIENKHLILALFYSLIAYTIFSTTQIRHAEFLATCFFSLVTGIIIWYAGLWTAADAKLFFVYSVMIPLSVYKYGYIHYFSFVNILINTFVPVFLFLFISLIFKTGMKQKLFYLKNSFSLKKLLNLAIFLFALTWLIDLIFSFLNLAQTYFFSLFITFLFLIIFEKLFSINIFNILIIISIIRLIFDRNVYSLHFIYQFLIILAIFVFVRFFALTLGFKTFTKKIKIDLLKPGMIPAETIIKIKNKYRKQKALYFGIFPYFRQRSKKSLIQLTAEGLTEEDIEILKKLKPRGFEYLAVQTTVPFAPFMFGGVLLTILFKGNMFLPIITFFQSIFL